MNRPTQIRRFSAALFLWAGAAIHAAEPLEIRLKSSANVSTSVATIGQIAHVKGADSAVADWIKRLDVAKFDASRGAEIVTRDVVQVRLLLSNIPRTAYVLAGPSATIVRKTELDDQFVLRALKSAIAEQLDVAADDLSMRLERPLPPLQSEISTEGADVRIRPFMPKSLRLGNLRIKFGIYVGQRLAQIAHATVQVRVSQKVPVARREIAPGETLSNETVRLERRFAGNEPLSSADVLGKTAARRIAPGETIEPRDLRTVKTKKYVVRPRDVVRLVARKGPLTVVMNAGEALQSGAVGDSIRVRNPQSRKVITGRIVSASEVEVPF